MQTLIVVLVLLGCSFLSAQYTARGRLALPQLAGQTLVAGHSDVISHPGLVRTQVVGGNQVRYVGEHPAYVAGAFHGGLLADQRVGLPSGVQYASPAFRQYAGPVHQYPALRPVHTVSPYSTVQTLSPAPAQAYHTPLQYPASNFRTPAVRTAAILRQAQDVSHDGSYNFGFESEDGTAVQSSGSLKVLGPDDSAQVAQGSFTYTSPDGTPITTNWYADETGFHADGAHLPRGPINRVY